METKTFDVDKSIESQKNFTVKHGMPLFAPNDGTCWACNKNIYEEIKGSGITVERAESTLATGCPHCHRSFVD